MRFELRVLDGSGALSILVLDADTDKEAEIQAGKLGYSILSISKSNNLSMGWFKKKYHFNVLLFSQELTELLNAGLSLVVSIETLLEKSSDPAQQQVLQKLVFKLHEGQTFSQAAATLNDVFPRLLIAMIKASEKTGDLQQSLQRFVMYRSQLDQVKNKVFTAAIYPAVLLVLGTFVTLFLLGYVVPKFSNLYEGAAENIPFLSRLLINWGHLLYDHGSYVAFACTLMLLLIAFILTRKAVKTNLISWIWSIPNVGEKLRLYQLVRFYRTLGMLLQGGISLVPALQMAADLLSYGLNSQLEQAIRQVKEGQLLSMALEQQGLATAVSKRMMSVGEQAGNMGEMMENTAAFYDREIARWVDWVTRLIEPLMMIFIGVMIGGIVILMYIPIFDLADNIQ